MSLIRQLNSLAEPFGAEKFSYLLPAASFQGPHANANKTLSGQIAAKKSWIYIQSGSNVKCWHLLSCSINYLQGCQWQILQVINFFVCCAKSEFVLNLQRILCSVSNYPLACQVRILQPVGRDQVDLSKYLRFSR